MRRQLLLGVLSIVGCTSASPANETSTTSTDDVDDASSGESSASSESSAMGTSSGAPQDSASVASIDPIGAGAGSSGGGGAGGAHSPAQPTAANGGAGGQTPAPPMPSCMQGQRLCADSCVDTGSDALHCGDCDTACDASAQCEDGVCVALCETRVDCEVGQACLLLECVNLSEGGTFADEQSRDAAYGTSPRIDVAASGHAAVVWDATDTSELLVSRYLIEQGQWSAPVPIHEAMAPFPGSPEIAVDDAGNAVAVWHQGGNEYRGGWTNRYDAELDMWLGPEPIESEQQGFAESLHVVMDGLGNATVVWSYAQNETTRSVRGIRFDAETAAWGSVVDLSETSVSVDNVTVAADALGNVMASWVRQPAGKEVGDAEAAYFDVEAQTWSDAVAIDAHDLGWANHPSVTADGQGNFFVAWHQSADDGVHVWVNRYDATTGAWGAAVQLDMATGTEGAIWGKVAADEHGNCLAVWEESSALFGARFTAIDGWSSFGQIDPEANILDPRLVVDRGGNGIALFRGSSRVYVSRFDATNGVWGQREAIDPIHADRTSDPDIDIDAAGRVTATWHEIGMSGSWEVMTNRFE